MATEATLAEPKAKGDSAAEVKSSSAEPITTATVGGDPAPEQKGVAKDRASRVLKSLTPTQLREWKITGNLPDDVSIEETAKESGNENEKLLAQMTPAERKSWRETGVIADRILNPPKEKSAAKADESADRELTALADSSPLAKLHSLTVKEKDQFALKKGSEAEANEVHNQAIATLDARMEADRKRFSAAEQAATFEKWKTLAPLLPENLIDYIKTGVQPYLNAPYKFFREFTLNENFRREVLRAGFGEGGNLDGMVKVIAAFDAKFAPEKPKPRKLPPEPAASIGGKATAPLDEELAATQSGDFRRFRAAANRADHLRRTGR